MVEERMIEVTLLSASNLKDVNYLSKLETYAVLKFPPYVDYTTQVDHHNGPNPTWNEKLGFMIPDPVLKRAEGHLNVEIFTLSTLGPKFVCEASIPLIDISMLPRLNEPFVKKYPLKTNSGDFHGELKLSLTVGDKVLLKSSGQEPSFPIFIGPGTNRPTYDPNTKPLYASPAALTHGAMSPNSSMPLTTSHQPTPPPLVSPRVLQQAHDPMTLSQLTPPRAYGHGQPAQGQIAFSQQAPPPTHGKQYEYVPLSKPTTTLPPENYSEGGPQAHSYIVTTRPAPPASPRAFPQQPSQQLGPYSQGVINVPVTRTDEGGYGHASGYGNPANPLFASPLGKVLLNDLVNKSRPYGHGY